MEQKKHIKLGAVLTVILSLILIYIYFSPDVKNLNSRILLTGAGGDGLKAYYCYLYHIDHDSSALTFEGMNYPYGESIFFTDNQPLLSEIMRVGSKVFPFFAKYAIAVWNILILLSFALGALVIYLILTELKVSVIVSIFAGIGISLLSPQLGRMGAHYSLTYIFVIPLIFYLLLKFSKRQRLGHSIAIGALVLWSGFTHMYFVAMLAMVILLFWVFFVIVKPKDFSKWKTILLHVFVQFILPIIIIQLLNYLSSDVIDRGKSPYGFMIYLAHPLSVFLPLNTPYWLPFAGFVDTKGIEWEGIAYIGLVGGISFILFFVKIVSDLVRARFKTAFLYDGDYFLTFLFWSSLLILLYSFGVPFIFGLEGLIDYLGPIKQIRSNGRFAWIFFYSINILAFYSLWQFYKRKEKKTFPMILLVLSLGILLVEAHFNITTKKKDLFKEYPQFTEYRISNTINPLLDGIDVSEYQSILPLPYFHIGSENIWERPACKIKEKAFELSLHSGLPMNAVMMGRTSISQTYKSMEMVWEPYREPAILDDFPSDKPFLVLSALCNELSKGEQLLLKNSEFITQNDEFRLSSINPDKIKEYFNEYIRNLYTSKNQDAFFNGTDFSMPDSTVGYVYDNFNNLNSEEGFLHDGTKILPLTDYAVVFRDKLEYLKAPADVTISFWIKNITEDTRPTVQIITTTLKPDGKANKYLFASLGRNLKQIDGDWGLLEYKVRMNPGEKLSVVLLQDNNKIGIEIDDFLIRNSDTDVYGKNELGDWIINNRYFPKRMLE